MIHAGANETNIPAFRECGCSLNQLPNPIQYASVVCLTLSFALPWPRSAKDTRVSQLRYIQAIKKPRALFSRWKNVGQEGQTPELNWLKRSEGERAFDENPPLRSQRCLDVFAESQTRHNEGKVYDGQSKLVSPKKAISKEI